MTVASTTNERHRSLNPPLLSGEIDSPALVVELNQDLATDGRTDKQTNRCADEESETDEEKRYMRSADQEQQLS